MCAMCGLLLLALVTRVAGEGASFVLSVPAVFQVLHCTVLYCTVLYCTVLYCTVPAVLQGEQLQVTRSPAVTRPASFYSAPVRGQQWCVVLLLSASSSSFIADQ